MDFKEWLLLQEQPECLFASPQVIFLPDQGGEATKVRFDAIDMQFEKYWKLPRYNSQFPEDLEGDKERKAYWNTMFTQGFKAKLPFSSEYLVYNAMTRKATIGNSMRLDEAPHDWWAWAQFVLGNTVTYWRPNGIYHPALAQTA